MKATHFIVGNGTACGTLTPLRTSDPKKVNCKRCLKTGSPQTAGWAELMSKRRKPTHLQPPNENLI